MEIIQGFVSIDIEDETDTMDYWSIEQNGNNEIIREIFFEKIEIYKKYNINEVKFGTKEIYDYFDLRKFITTI